MSKRQRHQSNQTPKKKNSVKPATIIALCLILFPAIGLFLILAPTTSRNSPFSGFDVYTDCSIDPSILVSLQPFYKNSQDTLVTVSITGWDKNICNKLQINFPGTTYNHQYFIDAGYAIEAGVDPQTALTHEYTRRDIDNLIVNHDWIGQDIISFAPNELENFSGGVEFMWNQGVDKIGFGEFSLLLPFGAVNNGGTSLRSTQSFEVSLLVPDGYKLTSFTPDITRYKPFGNIAFYNFFIEGKNIPLSLTFQNPALENRKEIFLIFLSTLFGIGLTMGVELLIESRKNINAG